MRISDWSSDVCSSDLCSGSRRIERRAARQCTGGLDGSHAGAGCRAAGVGQTRGDSYSGSRAAQTGDRKNGRASCRERVCQYVEISVVAVSLNKKQNRTQKYTKHRKEERNMKNK